MTRVLVVIGTTEARSLSRVVAVHEAAEADLIIGLNEECSDGMVLKDRYGKTDVPVKVVSK